jgi:hypothetical protein
METLIGLIVLSPVIFVVVFFLSRLVHHTKAEFHVGEPKYPQKTPQAIWEWGQQQWHMSSERGLPTLEAQRKREIEAMMNQRLQRLGYRGSLSLDGPAPEVVKLSLTDQVREMKKEP